MYDTVHRDLVNSSYTLGKIQNAVPDVQCGNWPKYIIRFAPFNIQDFYYLVYTTTSVLLRMPFSFLRSIQKALEECRGIFRCLRVHPVSRATNRGQ